MPEHEDYLAQALAANGQSQEEILHTLEARERRRKELVKGILSLEKEGRDDGSLW